jgi:hypothetical protein
MLSVVPLMWAEVLAAVSSKAHPAQLPEEYRLAATDGDPFGLFTLTMTECTSAAGRGFSAEIVVHTSDHAAGRSTVGGRGRPEVISNPSLPRIQRAQRGK